MTQNTRTYDRFEYHLEDCDCSYCLFSRRKSKHCKNGCEQEVYPFENIRQEAIAHGRIKRKRGAFKCRE